MREAAVRTRLASAAVTSLPAVERPAAALPPPRTRFAGSVWSPAAVAAAAVTAARSRARARPPAALVWRAAAGHRAAMGQAV